MGQATGVPRIGVFVCHCGINIGGVVNVPEVVKYAKTLSHVVHAEDNLYTCASDGLKKIKEGIQKHDLNRVIVASCTPRTHEPLFRATCEEAGLNKYLFEMANIREHCSWAHMQEPKEATEKAKDIIRMAIAKARLLEPQEEPEIDVEPSTLIIGGGISGMLSALSLANQGFKVYLVEKEPELGGMLRHLHKLYPTMEVASERLNRIVELVNSNKNIEVLTSTVIEQVKGYIGNFEIIVRGKDGDMKFGVGTIIVATGAADLKPAGMYGYGEHENVITQLELEQLLKKNQLNGLRNVVMIQCVGAREEGRTYCSRICCMNAIKNALLIKETNPGAEIYILFRDLQTYGKTYEGIYLNARNKFIQFIRYLQESPPEVISDPTGKLIVRVYDSLLDSNVEIESDLVVLSTPLVPRDDAKDLSRKLKVPLGPDGFFFEAHVKLRPIDFATDGIYVCGTAHCPKDIAESISQALGVASRAGIPMAVKRLKVEAITSSVDEDLCSGCGTCVKLCPYGAIEKDEIGIAKVTEVVCKGCGTCAASCPEGAIEMRHFASEQLIAQSLSALGVVA